MDNEQQRLERAIAALKSGEMAAARQGFSEILRKNPNQIEAWVGLSLSTSSVEQRKEYLEHALRLDHAYARSALAYLNQMPTPQESNPPSSPEPVKDTPKQSRWRQNYAELGAVFLVIWIAFAGLFFFYNQQSRLDAPVAVPEGRYVFIDFYADW
jgi:hypothetical protein